MSPLAFHVDELTVRYGNTLAVDRMSLQGPVGSMTALLGPNGAGKSSVLQTLCTVLRPTGGTVRVFGHDVRRAPTEARRWLGVVFQERTLDLDLSVRRNLWFHARLFGLSPAEARRRIAELSALFGLRDRLDDDVEALSGGLSRRVEVVRALLHDPRLIVLDEPTTGLDPEARRAVWADLSRLRSELGVSVLYSTHYMDEAEHADEVVIVDGGHVVRRGSPAALKAGLAASSVVLATEDDALALRRLRAAELDADTDANGIVVRCDAPETHVALVVQVAGVPITSVAVRHPTLDDVYLATTAGPAEAPA